MTTRRQGGRQPGLWRIEAERLRRVGGYAWGARRIAQHLGVDEAAVRRYLKSLGFEPKSAPEPDGYHQQVFEPRLQQRIGWTEDDGPIDELPSYETTSGCYRTRPPTGDDDPP